MWTSVMLSMSCHLAQSIQELITHWMKLQGYFMTQVEPSNTISRLVTIHLAFVIKHVHEKASKSQHLGNIANIGWRELGSFTNVHIHVTICMSSSMWAKGKINISYLQRPNICWVDLIKYNTTSVEWILTCSFSYAICNSLWESSLLFVQLIRLFRLSTNIYQRKYCQQISFLSRSIFFPFAQLTGPGQVTIPPLLSSMVSLSILEAKLYFFSCSGLLLVWSLTNYSHHQRGKKELPSFYNSSMCSSWWHICHDRLACTLLVCLCAFCIFFLTLFHRQHQLHCMQGGTDSRT